MIIRIAQREFLAELRRRTEISDAAFHRLEEELDWAEMYASPRDDLELLDAWMNGRGTRLARS